MFNLFFKKGDSQYELKSWEHNYVKAKLNVKTRNNKCV